MKHSEFNWYGTDSKLVYAQLWQPEIGAELKAVICLVHGLGEHSGRYKHVANFFVHNGYAVMAFDHRGHGKSEGARGHVASYQVLLDQLDRALEECSKRFPGIKKVLYGHSMGGNIVINHALTRNPLLLGVVASAPWLRLPEPPPRSKVLLAKFMNAVYGAYRENNNINPEHISRDPAEVQAYTKDPMVHSKISAAMFIGGYEAAEQSMAEAATLHTNMLLMHGSGDLITDPEGSRDFAKTANSDMVTFKEWAGLYHEIHNEPEKQEVLQYVVDWIESCIRGNSNSL